MSSDATIEMKRDLQGKIDFFIEKESAQTTGMIRPNLVSCDAEGKTACFEFPVLEWELNFNKVMHGGIVATIFDTALGSITNYYSNTFAPTASLTVNFLKPSPSGDSLIVNVKITSSGKRLMTAYGEAILKSSGELVATAMGTFAVTSLSKPIK